MTYLTIAVAFFAFMLLVDWVNLKNHSPWLRNFFIAVLALAAIIWPLTALYFTYEWVMEIWD